MADSVVAKDQGRIFQARFFWLQVSRLFQADTKVTGVGFEVDAVKAFDDVAAYYGGGMVDELGQPLRSDHFSCKYHVTQAATFTWEDLMDPEFVGATRVSLLQRLFDVQKQYAPDGTGARFHLVTTGVLDPRDPLAKFIGSNGGRFRESFWDLTDASTRGTIRKAWREHLGLADDEQLKRVLRPLRFNMRTALLSDLGRTMDRELEHAGFRPVPDGQLHSAYDDLPFKLTDQGRKTFSREEILAVARSERLWLGTPERIGNQTRVGVRSFSRWAEWMEDQTSDMVCLLRHFGGRSINDPGLWSTAVHPEVESFAERLISRREAYLLHLDTHASIAFAAGYCLDPKSGVQVTPVQSGPWGKQAWAPNVHAAPVDGLFFDAEPEVIDASGRELVVGLSITHDVSAHVRSFTARQLPAAAAFLHLAAAPGPSNSVIRDGTHAWQLAQQAVHRIRAEVAARGIGRVHLMGAAPNALMFFLGRMGRSLGPITLYEFDFDAPLLGAYSPALRLPPSAE